jgi:hypothetical protein
MQLKETVQAVENFVHEVAIAVHILDFSFPSLPVTVIFGASESHLDTPPFAIAGQLAR